jgi:hypothetical protein
LWRLPHPAWSRDAIILPLICVLPANELIEWSLAASDGEEGSTIQTIVTMRKAIVTLRSQPMSHALDLTRVAPKGGSYLTAIFSLIGPALRVARAYEKRSGAADADLRALGIDPTAFDRISPARRDFKALN